MFLMSAFNTIRFLLVSTVLLLAMPQAGLTQLASSQVISDDAIEALDEVVVYGQPTLRLLLNEVHRAEENFYELFNTLNDGRQFDIKCFYRRPIGSQVPRRVCEAYFVKNPQLGSTMEGGGPPKWAYVRHKTRQMYKEMAALMDEHPELHAALMKFSDAKQDYEASIRDRCVNRLSICKK